MWTEWSGFSSCSTTCGTGIQIRTRLCMTGSDCVGLGTNSRVCTLASCKLGEFLRIMALLALFGAVRSVGKKFNFK